MVDFKKKIREASKKIDPIEIYDMLDRASDKGPLRPAQTEILSEWFAKHNDDNELIIKLHTGLGKTLIGLLILQSKLNQNSEPVIFVCPNKQLVEQTCEQAKQFGFKYCTFEDNDEIPNDFRASKKILITHVQKIFNGLSKFGTGSRSVEVGAIVLDDSHACIEHIENAFSIRIDAEHPAYLEILTLFEDELENQGLAKLEEIKAKTFEAQLPVPYWAWKDKKFQIVKILIKHKEANCIKFAWNLIKDDIDNCKCMIGSSYIEILPYNTQIELFSTYTKASCKVFMSATTNNDSFFLKGLGISKDVIKNPLVYKTEKWSGEKMILMPYEIGIELDRLTLVSGFAKPNKKRKFGRIALVPSYKAAELWKANGAVIANSNKEIKTYIDSLKADNFEHTIVFVNRYDGIDLPDKLCRVLIMDSKPFSQSLYEMYQEKCRSDSELIDIKIAQKIEQGLGRGVRGEKDYCVIIIATPDIINNVRSRKLKKFFSPQTNKQIEIGLEVTKMATEEAQTSDNWEILIDVLNQALKRDTGWKEYYKEEMDSLVEKLPDYSILEILHLEKEAEDLFSQGLAQKAKQKLQMLIDTYVDINNKTERGWYLQEMARYAYEKNKSDSNDLQIQAHKINRTLLRPKLGMEIVKLEVDTNRTSSIKKFLQMFEDYQELKTEVIKLSSDLSFGAPSDTFEKALCTIGKLLGFASERPDNDWKEGPDNLWNVQKGEYIIFECKNEVLDSRDEIYKTESGQMNNSCAWFKNNYGLESALNVMIIPTKNISAAAGFNENVKILRKGGLNKLKKNIHSFIDELKGLDLKNISDEVINKSLLSNDLSIEKIFNHYYEDPFQRKS